VHSHFTQGRGWLDRLLVSTDDRPTVVRAKALFAAGMLSFGMGDWDDAVARHEASRHMARAVGSQAVEALAEFGLGDATRKQGRSAEAIAHFELALVLFRSLGDRYWPGITYISLALDAYQRGDVEEATRHALDAERLLGEAGDSWSIAQATAAMGEIARVQGDAPRAIALYARALIGYRDHGDRYATARILDYVASVASSRGLNEPAARLAGAAVAIRKAVLPGAGRDSHVPHIAAVTIARAHQVLGESAFQRAWAAGGQLSVDPAVTEATALAERLAAHPTAPVGRTAYPAGLSEREAEVLQLVAVGLTNAQIAERLFLSKRTVDAHLQRIYAKLDVTTRAAAIRFALEHGLA
jgi:ATP/maltotriose-dependent transcriptional regulator MalT